MAKIAKLKAVDGNNTIDFHIADEIEETGTGTFKFTSDGKLYINEFIEGSALKVSSDSKMTISGELKEGGI